MVIASGDTERVEELWGASGWRRKVATMPTWRHLPHGRSISKHFRTSRFKLTTQDLFKAHFEEVSTAEQFKQASCPGVLAACQGSICSSLEVRNYMFDTGADLARAHEL